MRIPALICLLLSAAPMAAETLSEEVGRSGIAATVARLGALQAPSDEERFALGGLQFLHAIEGSFQTRYAYGMTDRTGMLPLLRLPLTDNPAAKPLDPAAIAAIFRDASAGFTSAQTTLSALPDTSDFGLTLNFADLWFDVNADGQRAPEESLMEIAGPALLGWQWSERDPATPAPIIRFDVADAAWLSAYAHLLNGISQMVLAYDPTEPITRILSARAELEKFGPLPGDFFTGGDTVPDSFDIIAMMLATLEQQPDKALTLAAQTELLAMVADNRRFWALVEAESDNDHEWLPNDRQQSGLGLPVPAGTGKIWLGVLDDAEAMLKGEKLVPYWRAGSGGVNIARLFTDPRPIDVAGWIQGWAALPYLEQGETVSPESWQAFENLTQGEAMLMALWLN